MAKRYIHSAKDSILVENGSEQHEELIEGGEYFNDKADVEYPDTPVDSDKVEAEQEAGEQTTAIVDLSDEALGDLYVEVDAEMVKRDLFETPSGDIIDPEEEEGDAIDLDALNDDELRALGQKHKIKSFANMKRETLIEALKAVPNA